MVTNKCTYTDVSNHIIFFLSKTFRPLLWLSSVCLIRGGADKSLARPGRKQATATKLGIYSTYSPRSSMHFLARCSNFCKPLKKTFRRFSVQPGLRGSNDLRVGRKMATFQLYFQFREQGVVRRGQIRRMGWVMEAQAGQFLLGCKCPVSRGIVVQEQDSVGDLPAAFFLQNVLQLYQQRWVILRVDSMSSEAAYRNVMAYCTSELKEVKNYLRYLRFSQQNCWRLKSSEYDAV